MDDLAEKNIRAFIRQSFFAQQQRNTTHMAKVRVKCHDDTAEVHCINPLFSDVSKIPRGPSAAELEGVDFIFSEIKSKTPAETTMMIMTLGLPKVLRVKEISAQLNITSVLKATETALNDTFAATRSPGDARQLFGIANKFTPEQNNMLLQTFAAVLK